MIYRHISVGRFWKSRYVNGHMEGITGMKSDLPPVAFRGVEEHIFHAIFELLWSRLVPFANGGTRGRTRGNGVCHMASRWIGVAIGETVTRKFHDSGCTARLAIPLGVRGYTDTRAHPCCVILCGPWYFTGNLKLVYVKYSQSLRRPGWIYFSSCSCQIESVNTRREIKI